MSRRTSEPSGPQGGRFGSSRRAAARAAPKPYRRPALRAYGTLLTVTGFGGSVMVDSGNNLQTP